MARASSIGKASNGLSRKTTIDHWNIYCLQAAGFIIKLR